MIHTSATQLEKFRRCKRIIGFEYVEGKKPPPSPKQEFGLDVHSNLEKWLSKGKSPDKTYAGEVAAQAIKKNLLPTPSSALLVEHKFQLPINDTVFTGFIDCLVPPRFDENPEVIDHKTTSATKYIKTLEDLKKDPQALGYSAYTALKYSYPLIDIRWIYYVASNPQNGKRQPAGVRAVQLTFNVSSEEFLEEWDLFEYDLKVIARIRNEKMKGLDLPPTVGSCSAFGGCPYQGICNLGPQEVLTAAIEADKRERGF